MDLISPELKKCMLSCDRESETMRDMENKHILTYGLNQKQNEILEKIFGTENVLDVTGDIVTLCTCPAAAIVIKTDSLNIRDIDTLNHTFGNEFNTAIIFVQTESANADHAHSAGKSYSCDKSLIDSRDFNFIYYIESDIVNMTETIREIKKRYAIPVEYKKAVTRMERSMEDIKGIFLPESKEFAAGINYIHKAADTYDKLTKLMAHIPELKIRERVQYRYMINSILLAAMQASGILQEDIEYNNDNTIGYHRQFIAELTECIEKYYDTHVKLH